MSNNNVEVIKMAKKLKLNDKELNNIITLYNNALATST